MEHQRLCLAFSPLVEMRWITELRRIKRTFPICSARRFPAASMKRRPLQAQIYPVVVTTSGMFGADAAARMAEAGHAERAFEILT